MAEHKFGGPSTDGTQHCFECGAIRKPDGAIILNTGPLPSWVTPAACAEKKV